MKRLKIALSLAFFCFISKFSLAQLVHLELLGAGSFYSVNYDNKFSEDGTFGYRVGLGVLPVDGIFSIPLQLNYVAKGEYGFEVGLGVTYINSINQLLKGQQLSGHDFKSVFPTITLGYRFQTTGPLNFRVGNTTTIITTHFPFNVFWQTLGIGFQF